MSTSDDTGQRYRALLAEATRTIRRLSDRLAERQETGDTGAEPIAVLSAAVRMPGGADTPERFWTLLRDGVDTTSEFPASRGDAGALYHPDPDHPGTAYVIRGAFLDRVDGFDPAVFGISPREAVGMDPQQRIVLELAWEALERAGIPPTSLNGSRTGVYVGVSTTDYVRMRQQLGDPDDVDAYQLVGEPSFIAGRVSYTLGLRGPSEVIDTTCSSSLVAVHQASQALRRGECDMALAGGVNLMLSPYGFLLMSKFRALAADGRCKTFDAAADGYARGEGAGLLLLKRESDAVADRDPVLARVRGSAVNHDGRSSGLTVPNPAAQQDVIRRAVAEAGVEPADVTYVEAHGTGTSLGDPIELRALDATLGEGRTHPLLVGSVKTNVGHLEPAAGIAGLVKTIWSLREGEIPPHLNLTTPNPKIPWRRLRIEVPTAAVRWPAGRPRVAGVSSFGASGTNAHVVVDAVPAPSTEDVPEECGLLTLSARTPEALRELAARYAGHVTTSSHRLADICYTSQVGRARLAHGLVVTGATRAELAEQLRSYARGDAPRAVEVELAGARARQAGWLLTGQGAQYAGMAGGLRDEPAFAGPFRDCCELLDPLLPAPLAATLWESGGKERVLDNTGFTQPALFALEYALGKALMSWGLTPAALLGHSIGEIAAACLAGALDLPDAATLVAHRARLMAALPAGGLMVAVSCDEATARKALAGPEDAVAIAAVNGPGDVVLSGEGAAVREVAGRLAESGCRTRELPVSHAFHSPSLQPMLAEFATVLDGIAVRAPKIPVVSNVTGRFWTDAEQDPRYWLRHATSPVRFHDGLTALREHGVRTFVEVGPQPVLTGLGRKAVDDPACAWIGLLRRGRPDRVQLLRGLGTLHLRGARVDWARVHGDRDVRRVPGPTYPWQRERYWFRPANRPAGGGEAAIDGLGTPLRGPDPAYEQELPPGRTVEAAGALGWLVERSLRAATAGHGGRWTGFAGAEVDASVPHQARGPWLVQTVARPGNGTVVEIRTSGASPEAARAGARWQTHGILTARRAPGPAVERSEPGDVPVEPDGGDEAAQWGRIVTAAARQLGGDGWAYRLDEACCADPAAVRSLRVHRRAPDGDEVTADVTLHDDTGARVGALYGLHHGPLPAPPAVRWYPEDQLVHQLRWVPGTPRPAPVRAKGARVLLVGDGTAAGPLADALRRAGAAVTVDPDPDGALDDPDLTHVLVSGVDLPAAGDLTATALADRVLASEQRIVALTRRIAGRADPPRLVLLTRGAVTTGDGDTSSPAASTWWGLGRVIALEHPDAWGALLDLDPGGDDDPAEVAATALDPAGEDQWAFRGRRRYVARLAPLPAGALPDRPARRPHRPGTVLVTGGWGGIGTALAEWLARRGTERLVLAGRTGLPPEDRWDDPDLADGERARVATVRRLRALGAEVEAAAADVTDGDAVGALVGRLAGGPLPLRGVVHAAGVSGPQDLVDVDAAEYRRVWAPKVIGAWLLHEHTRHLDLDLFVCLSSIAATWGSQHLASYAAANNFLDGLADHRRALGLPALTVDWGPWGLRSHLFENDVMAFLESVGLRQLDPDQCADLLGRMLPLRDPRYVVCAADWTRYRAMMESRAPRPVFADLATEVEAGTGTADRDLLDRWVGAGDEAGRREVLAGFLRGAVAGVLGADAGAVAADADVFGLGLDSLMVMQVVTACREQLGVSLRPNDFFARSSLADWTAHLDDLLRGAETASGGGRAEEADDTEEAADPYVDVANIVPRAQLPDDVRPVDGPVRNDPERVLLTGATGFVGAFLLDELLASTGAHVECLVRCADPAAGLARVRRAVEAYLPWRPDASARVSVLPGDLAEPRLGLGEEEFTALAGRVDTIHHAGAWVDFVHTFDQVAPANIGGTVELLRLASRGRPKRMNHVSTYGIWGLPVEGRRRIAESDDIGAAGRLLTGYVQTKWGAELVVRQAAGRGLPVRTYRLGRVLGDSRSGACLTTHFTCRVIKGCVQLGLAPDLGDLEIEMTPVDYTARATVHLAGLESGEAVYHLVNPHKMPFHELVDAIRDRGWRVRTVPRDEWWAALQESVEVDSNVLHPVMDIVREFVVGGEEAIDYDVTAAEKALDGSGITCPPLDRALLDTYFDYFVRSGYLTDPRRGERHG
ncbi:MAG: thioester reductase domain-containing protein [Mycobacteriales bacterium]